MTSASWADGNRAFFRQMLRRVCIGCPYTKKAPRRCGALVDLGVVGRAKRKWE